MPLNGEVLKEAAEAGKTAAKGSSRSYMGQLHSGLTKAGESMGMSNNVSKYTAGLGMAGAGIGAFNIANNTSENHPFLGGAMKVGIIAGAGYAALKGHTAELEKMEFKQGVFDFDAPAHVGTAPAGKQSAFDFGSASSGSTTAGTTTVGQGVILPTGSPGAAAVSSPIGNSQGNGTVLISGAPKTKSTNSNTRRGANRATQQQRRNGK